MSKQALVRDAARRKRNGGAPRKKAAPKRIAPLVDPGEQPSSAVLARAHDREFAKMNERKRTSKRVKAAGGEEQPPRYLADAARGLLRRVARYAMAPVSLARAVVDRLRDRD